MCADADGIDREVFVFCTLLRLERFEPLGEAHAVREHAPKVDEAHAVLRKLWHFLCELVSRHARES